MVLLIRWVAAPFDDHDTFLYDDVHESVYVCVGIIGLPHYLSLRPDVWQLLTIATHYGF